MHEKLYTIKILPLEKEIKIDGHTNVRAALLSAGIQIKSICGGFASCGMCKIKIIQGKENISSAEFREKELIGNVLHITKERLSCQVYLKGDITIDISEHL